jgi:diketogulonate reductase-like aldo/keto reductase
MIETTSRRLFIAGTAALVACGPEAPGARDAASAGEATKPRPPHAAPPSDAPVPRRKLGKTGAEVSIVGVGGYHVGLAKSDEEATRIVRHAIDRGVNFLDNAWDYHGGKSEERMGAALRDGYRDKAFLMTKVDGRTRAAAMGQLEQSLARLETDHIDLLQIHEVIRPTDPEACFAPGGCIEALVEAKKAGKIRFIGFTGHKDPSIHLHMLEVADAHGFEFDTIMMPLNVLDAHFRSFEHDVLPVAVKKGMGVLSMKPLGAGEILKLGTVSAVECLHYAMSRDTNVVITGCDRVDVVDQAVLAAQTYRPLTPDAVAGLLAKTREAALTGSYEQFKTSDKHDSTAKHPAWLSEARI